MTAFILNILSTNNMNTLEYILNKYKMEASRRIEIPNVGRDHLAALPRDLGFKKIVEVGVQQGRYSEILTRKNPQATVYGVDPWEA